jgi:hypothetical protein
LQRLPLPVAKSKQQKQIRTAWSSSEILTAKIDKKSYFQNNYEK